MCLRRVIGLLGLRYIPIETAEYMADTITPKVLSIENMVARARANSSRPQKSSCPTCHSILWASFFFDGTGNHAEKHFPNSHSNVAALRDAHLDKEEDGVFRRYYEGLGMPFEFKDRYEKIPIWGPGGTITGYRENKGYEEKDESALGKGFANGITERLEKATFDLIQIAEDYRSRLRVDEINVAAFGFSRGATEARAFVNWISRISGIKSKGKNLTYHDIPLNVKFLGVFDTVESVGMAADNMMPALVKTTLPAYVQKCTHIVAAHELRHAFPLTLADGNARHVVYPGAHADIGGGYEQHEQGRSNALARVALMQMLDEARGVGLKMMSLGEMQASDNWEKRYMPSFGIHDNANKALQAYLAVAKPSGSIRAHIDAHMREYWQWIDSGQAITDVKKKSELWRSNAQIKKSLAVMKNLLTFEARTQQGKGYKAALAVPETAATHLFSNYVHDSFEHFSATGGTLQTDLSDANYYKPRALLAPTA